MAYKTYLLEDVLRIKYGKNQKKVKDDNGDYPILGTGGLMGFANDYLYDKPSVLIGRKGSISKVRFIDQPFWTVDTLFYTEVNEEVVFPKYIYYYLSLIDFNYYNEGTTIPSLRTQTLNQIEISLPNKAEQLKTLNILKPIENKIRLNKSVITNLEELAQTLFKHWFVDFEFPNENGEPYKSSGGKMVESELGMIPEGWKVITISDISQLIMGQSPKSSTYNDIKEGLPLINGASDFKKDNINPLKYTSDPKRVSQKGDFLFGVRATVGNVTYVENEYALGRGVGISRPIDREYSEFIYFQLIKGISSLESSATGSVYINFTRKDLETMKVVLPENDLIRMFHKKSNCFLTQKYNLLKENTTLSELRDTLLPKLLSGEIELPETQEVTDNVSVS